MEIQPTITSPSPEGAVDQELLGQINRLLPDTFIKNIHPAEDASLTRPRLWGQFIDHNGVIKQDMVDTLFRKLNEVGTDNIADAFPLHVMEASGPIEDFYNFKPYGITDSGSSLAEELN